MSASLLLATSGLRACWLVEGMTRRGDVPGESFRGIALAQRCRRLATYVAEALASLPAEPRIEFVAKQ